jgi:hypothetical protein
VPPKEIAQEFDVRYSTIVMIKTERTWAKVEPRITRITKYQRPGRPRKLTDDDVGLIKRCVIEGMRRRDIAIEFDTDPSTVSAIRTGRRYGSVPPKDRSELPAHLVSYLLPPPPSLERDRRRL